MKYTQAYDGGWIRPIRKGYRVACCDCGLVHVYEYTTVKDRGGGRAIVYRATRNVKATAARRKRLGITVSRKK